jgi:uncharacterized membrane protein
MWAIGIIVGALVGAAAGNIASATFGAALGFVVGIVAGRDRKSRNARIAGLEASVAQLAAEVAALKGARHDSGEAAPAVMAVQSSAASATDVSSSPSLDCEPAWLHVPVENAASMTASSAPLPVRKGGTGVPRPEPARAMGSTADHVSAGISLPTSGPTRAARPAWINWLLGGNTFARIGILILFIGVCFLLKFAAERVIVPIELRFAGVALGGIVLLFIGWKLRVSRTGYAMILQGGGVGVLYITIFASLRLYSLLPPAAAFVMLFLIAALSSGLAVRQDAIALAVLGVIGGFLAPILTSSGSGNHVVLFSYYALLNASILGIAWFRAWRALNLIGFLFTFGVGIAWGVTRYRPELLVSTEPFLILAFVFYVAVAVLYAIRRPVALRGYVDSTLVFGTPLVVAGLQSGLVHELPFGMAISALAASALYLALAKLLYARGEVTLRLLVEAFLALGVLFGTLAIPLALDARWTSATWALEGAALVWIGVRQQRVGARIFGMLLQLASGASLVLGIETWSAASPAYLLPVLNRDCLGAIIVALSGLLTAWLLQRASFERKPWERGAVLVLFAWGLAWWLFAGWHEIDRWLPDALHQSALIGFLTLTALLFAGVESAAAWPLARVPSLALLPVLLLVVGSVLDRSRAVSTHLFADGGYVAWPLAVVVATVLLRRFDRTSAAPVSGVPLDLWHAGLLWLVTLLVASELAWAGTHVANDDGVWTVVPWGMVAAAALLIVTAAANSAQWPMDRHRVGYLIFGALPIAAALALWTLVSNVQGDGDPRPLPYLPLLNPLDIAQALALLALATWSSKLRRDGARLSGLLRPAVIGGVIAALAFVWINGIVLRSIHAWYDVAYTPHALWASRLVQVALSLMWSVLAFATMVIANRRHLRVAWVAGASLLAVVVAKLFVVDLSQVGAVERIVSFIGVGLFLLLIGFLAPVPPRRTDPTLEAT